MMFAEGFFELRPTRSFTVALPPADAVAFVCRQWAPLGFTQDPWDFDEAQQGEGGWVGTILREGNDPGGMLADAVGNTLPFLLVLPWLRKQHGSIQVAVIARATGDGSAAELLCSLPRSSSTTAVTNSREFVMTAMNALGDSLRSKGLLIDGPTPVAALKLPDSHPLSARGWAEVSKTMRRNVKRGSR